MTGMKKLVYPLGAVLILLVLAVAGVISWGTFVWPAAILVVMTVVLGVAEASKSRRAHT